MMIVLGIASIFVVSMILAALINGLFEFFANLNTPQEKTLFNTYKDMVTQTVSLLIRASKRLW